MLKKFRLLRQERVIHKYLSYEGEPMQEVDVRFLPVLESGRKIPFRMPASTPEEAFEAFRVFLQFPKGILLAVEEV